MAASSLPIPGASKWYLKHKEKQENGCLGLLRNDTLLCKNLLHSCHLKQRRQWHPTPVLLLGKSQGQRSLVGYSPWSHKELDTTEQLHFTCSLPSQPALNQENKECVPILAASATYQCIYLPGSLAPLGSRKPTSPSSTGHSGKLPVPHLFPTEACTDPWLSRIDFWRQEHDDKPWGFHLPLSASLGRHSWNYQGPSVSV